MLSFGKYLFIRRCLILVFIDKMLIRGQFIEKNDRSVIHGWSLFVVPEKDSLLDIFHGISSEKYSCGRKIDFENFESSRSLL